jgi:hypothetical protein
MGFIIVCPNFLHYGGALHQWRDACQKVVWAFEKEGIPSEDLFTSLRIPPSEIQLIYPEGMIGLN